MRTKVFRIYLRDWKILRKIYPGMRGETCAEYFDRIIKFLEKLK